MTGDLGIGRWLSAPEVIPGGRDSGFYGELCSRESIFTAVAVPVAKYIMQNTIFLSECK